MPTPPIATPAGSSHTAPRRSDQRPNSGWTIELASAEARIRPAASVYERSYSSTRNGSIAGSTPPAKSTAMCPVESAAIARLSISSRTRRSLVAAPAAGPVGYDRRRHGDRRRLRSAARRHARPARSPTLRPTTSPPSSQRARRRRSAARRGSSRSTDSASSAPAPGRATRVDVDAVRDAAAAAVTHAQRDARRRSCARARRRPSALASTSRPQAPSRARSSAATTRAPGRR